MMDRIVLTVVSPNGELINKNVSYVQLPAHDGSLGVLFGHEPMIAALSSGKLFYTAQGKKEELDISGGVATISPDSVRVIIEE